MAPSHTATAQQIIDYLGLTPLPGEGGFYRETYRSSEQLTAQNLPPRYKDARSISTAIYYLITPEYYSTLHRIATDEIFHFYSGDTVQMVILEGDALNKQNLKENNQCTTIRLGANVLTGEVPQQVVRAGVWQGLRLVEGGSYALLGTTVAPGFDFSELEIAGESDIFPQYQHSQELLSPYLAKE